METGDREQPVLRCFEEGVTIESARTPPASWYTTEEISALEKECVFRAHWLFVGRSEGLVEPGDYFTGEFLGWPYLVTVDEKRELRAFYNVCSHHGTCVAEGVGRKKSFVCPYHGWTYGLAGTLKKAPGAGALESLRGGTLNLKPIHVDRFGPFIALHFGQPERSVVEQMGDVLGAFSAPPFESLLFVQQVRYEVGCNWKVFVDNYLDGGYHVPHMHPSLAGQLELSTYETVYGERWSMQSCGASGSGERLGERADYAWVYPNFMINRYGPWMDTNTVIPLGADRCLAVFDYFYEGTAPPSVVKQGVEASAQVQREDMVICGRVQKGLGSGAYERGVYASRFEMPMFRFHQLLGADLGA